MAVPAILPGAVVGTTVRLPMMEPGPGGKRITLEATLYRPAGDGPHPVLVFNHGSTGGGAVATSTTMRSARQAQFFVERGFAVLAPMRRGRGASEGVPAEHEGTCDPEVLGNGMARAIEDVDAAMAYVRAQTWATFRGVPGRACHALVIGTGAHRAAVRRMLRAMAVDA